eukprot:TRINITY_DN37983_c0_g2_i1.p1 TRINITY_DN37983_c0_g2~~TRINITY_DN37983_c0_g2_i1.p1  ORF type:complete len:392 (+),score=53.72 TRINITY_DN37983_c0_g2_i1:241-1416(+)
MGGTVEAFAVAAVTASVAAAVPSTDALCKPYYDGYTPCFVDGYTWDRCCGDLGKLTMPLSKDDGRWKIPHSPGSGHKHVSTCFDGKLHTAIECCTSNWTRVVPALPPSALQADLEATHLASSTLTKYDFFGTEVVCVAFKQDDMDWLHLELVLRDQYRLRELRLRAHAVVLDVGCASGLVSIVLAKWFPLARIFCVEPNPVRLLYLRWNLRLNSVEDRVTVIPTGLGQRSVGTLQTTYNLHVPRPCLANLPPYIHSAGGGWVTQVSREAPTRTFAEIQAQYGIGRPGDPVDLLKVDCEGCEYVAELPPAREVAGQVHDPRYYFGGGSRQFHVVAFGGYRPARDNWAKLKMRVDAVHGRFCRNSTSNVGHIEGCPLVARWLGRRAHSHTPPP